MWSEAHAPATLAEKALLLPMPGWVTAGCAGGWEGAPKGPFSVRMTVVCPTDARRRQRFLGAVRVGSWLGHPRACTASLRRGWRRGPGFRRSGPLVTNRTAPGEQAAVRRGLGGASGPLVDGGGRRLRSRAGASGVTWRLVTVLGRPSITCSWWLRGPRCVLPGPSQGCQPYWHLSKRSRGGPASGLAGNWTLSGAGGCLGLELRSWPPPLGCCSLRAPSRPPSAAGRGPCPGGSWGRASSCHCFTPSSLRRPGFLLRGRVLFSLADCNC